MVNPPLQKNTLSEQKDRKKDNEQARRKGDGAYGIDSGIDSADMQNLAHTS